VEGVGKAQGDAGFVHVFVKIFAVVESVELLQTKSAEPVFPLVLTTVNAAPSLTVAGPAGP
jgi:hypothetical protein